jgi:hypothetical protein
VLVAAFGAANKRKSACAAHTLAEVYSTMTALPVKDVIPPEQALLFVQETRDRFTIVTLTENDYYRTIEQAAAHPARLFDPAREIVPT